MKLIPVVPIGKEIVGAFVNGRDPKTGKRFGGFRQIEINSYPPSWHGQWLREARRKAELTLRDAARHAGISPSDFSELENGKLTLSEQDWESFKKKFVLAVLDS